VRVDVVGVDAERGAQQALALRRVTPEEARQPEQELALADQRVRVVRR